MSGRRGWRGVLERMRMRMEMEIGGNCELSRNS